MRPASKKTDNRIEMFRERLDNILNRHHELCKLAALIDWEAFEREFGMLYADKKGRPGIPIRLLVGLSYRRHHHPRTARHPHPGMARQIRPRNGATPAPAAHRSVIAVTMAQTNRPGRL